jgi:hypothetical protein
MAIAFQMKEIAGREADERLLTKRKVDETTLSFAHDTTFRIKMQDDFQ